MTQANSLENLPKRQLAEQHAALVREVMLMWGEHFPMVDWVDPLSAIRVLRSKLTKRPL